MKTLVAPDYLRKGQALFIFLAWLAEHKSIPAFEVRNKETHFYLGDTFHLTDDRLESWWEEWTRSLDHDDRQATDSQG